MKNRDFDKWLSTMNDSIATWKYYTDFEKVYKNAEKIKTEIYILNSLINIDVLPIAKARGFWDTDEPCYQKTVLRVLSTMDNALPIFIYYLREKKILSPSFFIFIAPFKSLS